MIEFDEFFSRGREIKVTPLEVPPYVNFISEWKDFPYPQGHCIVDKTVCGCGFTEYCLRNQYPTILCSPRKVLLENKEDQHNYMDDPSNSDKRILNPNPEYPVYYFRNEKEAIFNYDSAPGLKKEDIQKYGTESIEDDEKQGYIKQLKINLVNWLTSISFIPKILVTYDSLEHVLDALGPWVSSFNIVVDEFQSIFSDSTFKAETELGFVEILKKMPNQNVLYLSATPTLARYLGMIDYLNELPFYKLEWPRNKIESISIDRRFTTSIVTSCTDLIKNYKEGNYKRRPIEGGKIAVSKEIVFFVNSVKTICDIIRKADLQPEECNIICAHSNLNLTKIKKLGKGFGYGKIPTKKQKNKMFTFCTRTAYLGADFYSNCALTVVCSDITVKTLNIDISLDLPQIVGRQRLPDNIFRKEVLYFQCGRIKGEADVTLEEFIADEREKEEHSTTYLNMYGNNLNNAKELEAIVKAIKDSHKLDYYGYSYIGLDKSGQPTYNSLAKVASVRGYEISRPEYQESVIVRREDLSNNLNFTSETSVYDSNQDIIKDFVNEWNMDDNMQRQLKLACDFYDSYPELYKTEKNKIIPKDCQDFLYLLGTKKIRALEYRVGEIRKVIEEYYCKDDIKAMLILKFIVGEKYSLKSIKESLRTIYDSLNVDSTPKASDLEKYFDLRECQVAVDGKRSRGYEIISIK